MAIPQTIQDEFTAILGDFLATPIVERIRSGSCDRDAYAGMLSQIYHQVGWNPQLQAAATMHFRGKEREQVGRFLAHARSEVGHDQMAFDDLQALGYAVEGLAESDPLPETAGLIGYAQGSLQWTGPAAYLGYLFFLEFTPTTAGKGFAEGLERAGIPREAMTFLAEHIVVDEGHNKLMEQYIDGLLATEDDQREFLTAVRTTARLYEHMLTAGAEAGTSAWAARTPVGAGA